MNSTEQTGNSLYAAQDAYKHRMDEAGFVRTETRVHPEDKATIRRIGELLREFRKTGEPFTYTLTRGESEEPQAQA